MNKGLTIRTAQQHGQRYMPRMLEYVQQRRARPLVPRHAPDDARGRRRGVRPLQEQGGRLPARRLRALIDPTGRGRRRLRARRLQPRQPIVTTMQGRPRHGAFRSRSTRSETHGAVKRVGRRVRRPPTSRSTPERPQPRPRARGRSPVRTVTHLGPRRNPGDCRLGAEHASFMIWSRPPVDPTKDREQYQWPRRGACDDRAAIHQRGAVRLIFEYEGDTVRLVSQEPVDVAIPPLRTGRPARRPFRGDQERRGGLARADPRPRRVRAEHRGVPRGPQRGDHPGRHRGARGVHRRGSRPARTPCRSRS